ncbi:hypothetical protein [Serratia fonticola]|uniref:RipA family octameric membrane protein n=1 Tax=Serratia fonticola TaxID=47917 RepID=UPI00192A76F6|nr:hypothetical protein [Serratia fonticola]MBL5903080.1 hypothetical protein [Serratia fonticola]
MDNRNELTDFTIPSEHKEYYEELLGKRFVDGKRFSIQDYERLKEAYTKAHDIRKFEIELYWKRSAYFITFLSILTTICGVVTATYLKGDIKDNNNLLIILYVIGILGVLMSLQFLVACQAGKFLQENWERHIDLLEPIFSGNLYKMNLISKPKRQSLSAANEIVGLTLFLVFTCFIIYSVVYISSQYATFGGIGVIGFGIMHFIISYGRSKNIDADLSFSRRKIKSVGIEK